MVSAEFEEKEYEGPLYNQLERGDHRLWSPGQVLEQYLGFDRGLFLEEEFLWSLHGMNRPFTGIVPRRIRWHSLPRGKSFIDRLPNFALNCFIQAKRPLSGSRVPKKLVSLGAGRPYFCFRIEMDQQGTLEVAANHLRGRALFTYASPTFASCRELFGYMSAGTIVERSTFPSVEALSGHKAWYYNTPGATGVPNPSFELVELPSFNEQIRLLIDRADISQRLTPSQGLAALLRELKNVVLTTPEIASQARVAYLAEEWRRQEAWSDTNTFPPALVSFLGVEAFATYFNLVWLTVEHRALQ